MKHLKTYEENCFDFDDKIKTPYSTGDEVICVCSDAQERLKVGEKYIINNITKNYEGRFYCTVIGIGTSFFCYRFVPEHEITANKFNL